MNFSEYLDARRKEVEAALESFSSKPPGTPAVVADAMRYSLLGGGKRLRPLLVLASAEGVAQAIGASESAARDLAMPAACAAPSAPASTSSGRSRLPPAIRL